MSVVLYVRIPEALRARLDELVEGTGLTMTTVAVEVLTRGLAASRGPTGGLRLLHELLDGAGVSLPEGAGGDVRSAP